MPETQKGRKREKMTADPETELREILESAKTVAVVGLSDKESRPSHDIGRFLLNAGYRVIPVNPNIDSVFGIKAVDSLDEISESVDIVNVFRRAEFAPAIARQAADIGAGTLWLQQGIRNDRAMQIAADSGLRGVQDRCIAVTYRLLGVGATRRAIS